MLVASILKYVFDVSTSHTHKSNKITRFFYWFGARYSLSLFLQACLMIIMQLILLKVALDNRSTSSAQHTPFSTYSSTQGILNDLVNGKRPLNFWRWGNAKPCVSKFQISTDSSQVTQLTPLLHNRYYLSLAYLTGTLLLIQVILYPLANTQLYISFLGTLGLTIEAILPIPQILKNHTAKSCKGFRPSVILNWVAGDAMKMSYFFLSKEYIPWPFKLCGIFQACCDAYLAYQFYIYGSGSQGLGYEMSMNMNSTRKPAKVGWSSSNT